MQQTGDTSREPWRLGHRPALDGLRGIAILLVLACHVLDVAVPRRGAPLGSAGVTVFFTLSGFLITSLLVEKHLPHGRRSLERFYARRARRLLPALLVVVAVVGAFQVTIGYAGPGAVVPVLFYFANWSAAAGHSLGLLPHTWSLAIEEQFYLAWPLLLLAVRRWRNGPLVAVAVGLAASIGLRFALYNGPADAGRVYFGSDTRADGLLVGCLLALLLHRGMRLRLPRWAAPVSVALIAAGSAALASEWATDVLVPTVVPWLTAAAIWSACEHPSGLLGGRVLGYFGSRSYGLYLWHFPLLLATEMVTMSPVAAVLAVAASVGVAEMSWRLVEDPILHPKRSADTGDAAEELVGRDVLRAAAPG